jgi:hypothetical protein
MPRQRLMIGTFGDISTRKTPTGRYEARTRYRNWDGHVRLVQATGVTAKAAESALKAKRADRAARCDKLSSNRRGYPTIARNRPGWCCGWH